jgi:DNA-binding response OmpR family regulator
VADPSLGFLHDMTVLLAEDDEALRGLMVKTLGRFFGEVLPAKDGGQALELFETYKPHMAILDITMPVLSGLEVAEAIREVDADLPIMILTGHDDAAYMQTAVRLRLMNYLLKPLSISSLEKALKGCLEEMKRRNRLEVRLAGGTLLNPATGTAVRNGRTHRLTRNERRFLEVLLKHRGVVVEPVQICLHMSVEKDFTSQALRNLVWRLRVKVGAEAIFSARDMGYMLR